MRPRDTGWFAEFGALSGRDAHKVAYGGDGSRFMGATFDPSGLYRLAATLDWMRTIGLTVDAIHAHVMQLQKIFLDEIKRRGVKPLSDARLVTPVGPAIERGHFLAFETGAAAAIHDRLAGANIVTDRRGERIRFGFGCYHTESDIAAGRARRRARARLNDRRPALRPASLIPGPLLFLLLTQRSVRAPGRDSFGPTCGLRGVTEFPQAGAHNPAGGSRRQLVPVRVVGNFAACIT